MKKTILSILVLCFVAFSVSAQVETNKTEKAAQKNTVGQSQMDKERAAKAKQTNPQVDNPNAPVITFEKMVHDYGTITKDDDGNCEFKFTNKGKEPLILSNVRSS